jgi:hypothetical protein
MNRIDFSYHNLSLHVINHTLDNWEQKEDVHVISFQGNSFTEKIDIIHLFENILSQFPNLYSLDFSDASIGTFEFYYILKYLSHVPKISHLNFSSNLIFYKSFSEFYLLQPYFSQLKELILDENEIFNKGVEIISSCFHEMKQLEKLSLKECDLTYTDFFHLGRNIQHLTNLSHFNISKNSISFHSTTYLLQNLPKEKIKYLNMKMKNIIPGYYDNNTIAHYLKQFKSCETLYWNILLNNSILKSICSLSKLKKLDLSTQKVFHDLNIFLKFPDTLEYVHFHQISNNNIIHLLYSITKYTKVLRIQNIFLDTISDLLLLRTKNLHHLTELCLCDTFLSNNTFKKLCINLFKSPNLKELNVSQNRILDSGFHCFFSNISRWKQLKFVSFYDNFISNNAVEKLLPRLNYIDICPLTLFLNFEIGTSTNFFQHKIKLIEDAKKNIEKNFFCNSDMESVLKLKKFVHNISVLRNQRKTIEEYNHLLETVKLIIYNKLNYIHFIKWMEKNVHPTDPIFHYYDLYTFLYQYI